MWIVSLKRYYSLFGVNFRKWLILKYEFSKNYVLWNKILKFELIWYKF